jgi:hypothetical protein
MSPGSRHARRGGVTIGVIGPHDLVERVMLLGHEDFDPPADLRLVNGEYRDEQETPERVAKLSVSADVILFTGPLPYDMARQADALTTAATYVPLSGSALYSALLRGLIDRSCDPARVSIDTISQSNIEEAYAEIGVPTTGIGIREYSGPEDSRVVAEFHAKLWLEHGTTTALTCIGSVARHLTELHVPLLRVVPTPQAIRMALRTAALLGTETRLEGLQIAMAIVEPPPALDPRDEGPLRYGRQELRLSLQQVLLDEARGMGAILVPHGENGFLIVATRGSFAAATENFHCSPFLEAVREKLGIAVEVGIGLGATAHEAESHARAALSLTREAGGRQAIVVGEDGNPLLLPGQHRARVKRDERSTGLAALVRLAEAIAFTRPTVDEPIVVDAEQTAELLGVSPRSARRSLSALVDEGLAWPLPVSHPGQRGRPRQSYRLVFEKLPAAVDRDGRAAQES